MTAYFPPNPPKIPWRRRDAERAGGVLSIGWVVAAIVLGGPAVLGGLLIARELCVTVCLCE